MAFLLRPFPSAVESIATETLAVFQPGTARNPPRVLLKSFVWPRVFPYQSSVRMLLNPQFDFYSYGAVMFQCLEEIIAVREEARTHPI